MVFHKRKPNRLNSFDYSSPNYYFVTVCAKNKQHYFGKIENCQMKENKVGKLIRQIWLELPLIFSGIALDEFTIMPNHIHGIIVISGSPKYKPSLKPATLSQIVRALKSKSNVFAHKQILPFISKLELWQKTFYDRVIRNEADLLKTREYIRFNVAKWGSDEYYQRG